MNKKIKMYVGANDPNLHCNADCDHCKELVIFGEIGYCGFKPPRCTLHDVIKGMASDISNAKRRCIVCANYHLKLNSDTCSTCLATVHLDQFKVQADVAEAKWYQMMSVT